MTESEIIRGLRAGNIDAIDIVVDRYFERIVRAAETIIAKNKMRASDGDDVAASVFESLWRLSETGQLTEFLVPDAGTLWQMLLRMTRRKVIDHMRRENADKRGGGQTMGESAFQKAGRSHCSINNVAQSGMTPSELVEFHEAEQKLMESLKDDQMREIATLRLEGFLIEEIGKRVGISDRSVKRKLSLIREKWIKLVDP